MCFVKCKFDQNLFKKILSGKKIKDTPFIGFRVGGLKINLSSDKKFFFLNDHFYLFNKTNTLNSTKKIVKC